MKHLFVPYELALLAKEKGFNEECFACYSYMNTMGLVMAPKNNSNDMGYIAAPLYQQLVDWFYDKYNILIRRGFSGKWEVIRYNNQPDIFDLESINSALTEAFKLI